MGPSEYQRWWALHLRVARGEVLPPLEQSEYEKGRGQLEQEEILGNSQMAARQALATVTALQTEQARLQARREEVDSEIARLEALLGQPTRQILGVED